MVVTRACDDALSCTSLTCSGYEDGRRRAFRDSGRQRLPPSKQLMEACHRFGPEAKADLGSYFHSTSGRDRSHVMHTTDRFAAVLVCLEDSVSVFGGPYASMTEEFKTMWRYWHCPMDGFCVPIKEAYTIQNPPLLLTRERSRAGRPMATSPITLTPALFLPAVPVDVDSLCQTSGDVPTVRSIGALLQAWGCSDGSLSNVPVPVLWLPQPLPKLISHNFWKSIMFRCHWLTQQITD